MSHPTDVRASEVMKTWFQRVWTDGDTSAIPQLLAADGRVHGLGPDPLIGPEAFEGFWADVNQAFQEIAIEVVDCVDDGNRAWVRCHVDGLVQGKKVSFEGGSQVIVQNGLITEAWNYWDFIGCMAQLQALRGDAFLRACAGKSVTEEPAGAERES